MEKQQLEDGLLTTEIYNKDQNAKDIQLSLNK